MSGINRLVDRPFTSASQIPYYDPVSGNDRRGTLASLKTALEQSSGGAFAPLSHVGAGGLAHAIVVSGGDAGFMDGVDKAKLDGIAPGATANSTDAALRDRATHTGTQLAATISNFAAAARAETEAELLAGTNITITPAGSGATRTLTIAASGVGGGAPIGAQYVTLVADGSLTSERVLTAGAGVSVTDGGAGGAVTVANTDRGSTAVTAHEGAGDPHPQYLTAAEGNAAYAPLSHVGTGGAAHADVVAAGAAGFMTGADKTKLDGIAAGATVNSTDAALRDRATHTGTQLASTISDFAAATRAQVEAALIAGTNVSITPAGSGATRTLTLAATGGGGGSFDYGLASLTAQNQLVFI